jgi:hypothetical protein
MIKLRNFTSARLKKFTLIVISKNSEGFEIEAGFKYHTHHTGGSNCG